MEQPARKSSPLSLVPPATRQANKPRDETAYSLESYFDGWLESVKTLVAGTETTDDNSPQPNYGRSSLTSKDVMRVNRATVRESTAHRHWPSEVVLKFLAADVINKK